MRESNYQNVWELVERAQAGDETAFGEIYRIYYAPVFRYIFLRVRHKAEAEDLVQAVFLKVFRRLPRLQKNTVSPLAYFFTVARNAVIDHWKKRRESSLEDLELDESESTHDDTPLFQATAREQSRHIREALQHLTAEQQDVIILRFINELSTKEIAHLLGKEEAAVRQLQARGLRSLHKRFSQEDTP